MFLKKALHNFKILKSNFKETHRHVPTLAHASLPRDCLWKGREDARSSSCLGDKMGDLLFIIYFVLCIYVWYSKK